MKYKSIVGEIVGLVNANTFIDDNLTDGITGVILSLSKKSNNKRISNLTKQLETIKSTIIKHKKRADEISQNIIFLRTEKLGDKQSALAAAEIQAENIDFISDFANPLAALAINKKSPEAIAELKKYMFMKVDEKAVGNLGGYDVDVRVSKTNSKIYIIRFLISDHEIIMNAIGGEKK